MCDCPRSFEVTSALNPFHIHNGMVMLSVIRESAHNLQNMLHDLSRVRIRDRLRLWLDLCSSRGYG